jgi:polyisoprenoid-binding protein YceI
MPRLRSIGEKTIFQVVNSMTGDRLLQQFYSHRRIIMKRLVSIISSVLVFAFPLIVSAATWNIDPDHTNVGFKVKHLMVSNVKGTFDKFTGMIDLDEKDITKSKVEVSIDTKSVNTNVVKRDEDLRSANFLDVAKYPVMTFTSKKVTKAGKGKLKVTGDLNLHGVTKEVVLDVEGPTAESKDPWGNIRKGASATTKINRKDFGLTWNKTLETGGVLVGDEVQINLEVEMVKVQPK